MIDHLSQKHSDHLLASSMDLEALPDAEDVKRIFFFNCN